eukprot:gene12812-17175_t
MGRTYAEGLALVIEAIFIYVGVFVLFYLFLIALLQFARKEIQKPKPGLKEDQFVKDYGYSYDYTFVFKVYDEVGLVVSVGSSSLTNYQKKFSLRSIVSLLQNAKLQCKLFYSCQRDEIYVKIRADPARLKSEAQRTNYRLLLDPEKLRAKAAYGKKVGGGSKEWKWKPIIITDHYRQCSFKPFDHIYAEYTPEVDVDGDDLYQQYPALNDRKHIFRNVDRIKLIISIIEAKTNVTPPGAGLNIRELVVNKVLLAAFPLQDYDQLDQLQKRWLKIHAPPWKQPVDEIRNYFGERIGFYFRYLQHYVEMLMWPALLGMITFLVKVFYFTDESFLMPYFTCYMVIWSTFYIESWKRKQSTMAMKWGTTGIEETERDRPLFKGTQINSPIDGKKMVYFDKSKKSQRVGFALSLVATLILLVIGVVGSIYFLQYILQQPENSSRVKIPYINLNITPFVSAILSAVSIMVSEQ